MAFRAAGFNALTDYNFDFGRGIDLPEMFPNPQRKDYGQIAQGAFDNLEGFNRAYQGMTDQAKLAAAPFAKRANENARTIMDNAFATGQVASANKIKERLEESRDQIKSNIDKDVAQKQSSNMGGLIGSGLGAVAGSVFPGVGTAFGATAGNFAGRTIGSLGSLFG